MKQGEKGENKRQQPEEDVLEHGKNITATIAGHCLALISNLFCPFLPQHTVVFIG